jgi:hypothetical protein
MPAGSHQLSKAGRTAGWHLRPPVLVGYLIEHLADGQALIHDLAPTEQLPHCAQQEQRTAGAAAAAAATAGKQRQQQQASSHVEHKGNLAAGSTPVS